jgi:hypothetical protein
VRGKGQYPVRAYVFQNDSIRMVEATKVVVFDCSGILTRPQITSNSPQAAKVTFRFTLCDSEPFSVLNR